MVGIRKRGEEIRKFILDNVSEHPFDIATLTANAYKISRQAANKHIRVLLEQGSLVASGGKTKKRHYLLHAPQKLDILIRLADNNQEDVIWRQKIEPFLSGLPDNVLNIWHYGFTEMMNNAIEHSSGECVFISIEKESTSTELNLFDDGVGIFKKIKDAFKLDDERHAVLELSKGKLTTDPARHTGEGIFFSSRMFDSYVIMSGDVHFSHTYKQTEDWITETRKRTQGTYIQMVLDNNSKRQAKKIFDEYSTDNNYGFTKTVVPVELARYGNENLVSRSQAKRLMARVEKFSMVILNFNNVPEIGQAFADEIFRVFVSVHPKIEIVPLGASPGVMQMIQRAKTNK